MCLWSFFGERLLTFVILCMMFGPPNPRVSPARFRAIRPGMTAHEVEKLVGEPSRVQDFSRYSVTKVVPTRRGARAFRLMRTSSWIGVDLVILVHFGEKERVEWTQLEPLEEWAEVNNLDSQSVLARLRYRLLTEPLQSVRDWLRSAAATPPTSPPRKATANP